MYHLVLYSQLGNTLSSQSLGQINKRRFIPEALYFGQQVGIVGDCSLQKGVKQSRIHIMPRLRVCINFDPRSSNVAVTELVLLFS